MKRVENEMQLVGIQHVLIAVSLTLTEHNMTLKTENNRTEYYCIEELGGESWRRVGGIMIARHQIILWHGPP